MKWMKISLETTTQAVDLISNLFDELGLEGVQIEDKVPLSEEEKQAMYIDILPELPPDDGKAVVSTYVNPEPESGGAVDMEKLIAQIKEGLAELSMFADVGEGTVKVEETDDKDWIDNWKAYFKPFRVAENIIIKPTWEALSEKREGDTVVEIDPGTAFGTGAHETTRLCIEGMLSYITEDTEILDVGCGSGILSIIALKLGAKHAVLTDIDPAALTAARENLQVNGLDSGQYEVLSGNIIEEKATQDKVRYSRYDVVLANILADVIIPLAGEIGKHMKPGAVFISSGIIDSKKEEVKTALSQNGFEILKISERKDWVSFTARKEGKSGI